MRAGRTNDLESSADDAGMWYELPLPVAIPPRSLADTLAGVRFGAPAASRSARGERQTVPIRSPRSIYDSLEPFLSSCQPRCRPVAPINDGTAYFSTRLAELCERRVLGIPVSYEAAVEVLSQIPRLSSVPAGPLITSEVENISGEETFVLDSALDIGSRPREEAAEHVRAEDICARVSLVCPTMRFKPACKTSFMHE